MADYVDVMAGSCATATRIGVCTVSGTAVTAIDATTAPFNEDLLGTISRDFSPAESPDVEYADKELIGGKVILRVESDPSYIKPGDGTALSSSDSADTIDFSVAGSSTLLKKLNDLKNAGTYVIVAGPMFVNAGGTYAGKPDHIYMILGKIKSAVPAADGLYEDINFTIEGTTALTTALTYTEVNTAMLFADAAGSERKFGSFGDADISTSGISVTGLANEADKDKLFSGSIDYYLQSYA